MSEHGQGHREIQVTDDPRPFREIVEVASGISTTDNVSFILLRATTSATWLIPRPIFPGKWTSRTWSGEP